MGSNHMQDYGQKYEYPALLFASASPIFKFGDPSLGLYMQVLKLLPIDEVIPLEQRAQVLFWFWLILSRAPKGA